MVSHPPQYSQQNWNNNNIESEKIMKWTLSNCYVTVTAPNPICHRLTFLHQQVVSFRCHIFKGIILVWRLIKTRQLIINSVFTETVQSFSHRKTKWINGDNMAWNMAFSSVGSGGWVYKLSWCFFLWNCKHLVELKVRLQLAESQDNFSAPCTIRRWSCKLLLSLNFTAQSGSRQGYGFTSFSPGWALFTCLASPLIDLNLDL